MNIDISKNSEQHLLNELSELIEYSQNRIMVAEYWTDLPPKNILEQKIQQAVIEAKERLERRKLK